MAVPVTAAAGAGLEGALAANRSVVRSFPAPRQANGPAQSTANIFLKKILSPTPVESSVEKNRNFRHRCINEIPKLRHPHSRRLARSVPRRVRGVITTHVRKYRNSSLSAIGPSPEPTGPTRQVVVPNSLATNEIGDGDLPHL